MSMETYIKPQNPKQGVGNSGNQPYTILVAWRQHFCHGLLLLYSYLLLGALSIRPVACYSTQPEGSYRRLCPNR